ncbi:MAG: CTB family bacteriocin [Rivularia sp. (in: cyanobacteria)]
MSNPIEQNTTPIELSEEQLDEIAGGVDIFLSGSIFQQRDTFSFRSRSSRGRRSSSFFKSSYISSATFQFIGLGFDSVSDTMSFVKGFMRLFGGR